MVEQPGRGLVFRAHSYDAPPNNANVWSNYNEYDTEAGFLSNFEADFRKAILDAVIRVAKNTATDGGGYEDITRKVFLLSNTEVGLSNENGVAEGDPVVLLFQRRAPPVLPDRRSCQQFGIHKFQLERVFLLVLVA